MVQPSEHEQTRFAEHQRHGSGGSTLLPDSAPSSDAEIIGTSISASTQILNSEYNSNATHTSTRIERPRANSITNPHIAEIHHQPPDQATCTGHDSNAVSVALEAEESMTMNGTDPYRNEIQRPIPSEVSCSHFHSIVTSTIPTAELPRTGRAANLFRKRTKSLASDDSSHLGSHSEGSYIVHGAEEHIIIHDTNLARDVAPAQVAAFDPRADTDSRSDLEPNIGSDTASICTILPPYASITANPPTYTAFPDVPLETRPRAVTAAAGSPDPETLTKEFKFTSLQRANKHLSTINTVAQTYYAQREQIVRHRQQLCCIKALHQQCAADTGRCIHAMQQDFGEVEQNLDKARNQIGYAVMEKQKAEKRLHEADQARRTAGLEILKYAADKRKWEKEVGVWEKLVHDWQYIMGDGKKAVEVVDQWFKQYE